MSGVTCTLRFGWFFTLTLWFDLLTGGEDPKKVTEEVMSRDLRFEIDDELVAE
jgi:hypothetical protein